jgi:hypothetical protein
VTNVYDVQLIAGQRTAEAIRQAEAGRLARIATCCRPSVLVAWARRLRATAAELLRPSREQACCA